VDLTTIWIWWTKARAFIFFKSHMFNFSNKPLGICVLEDGYRDASVIMNVTFRIFW